MSRKVLIINGSLRQGSFNQVIVDFVKAELEAHGVQVKQSNISDLPFMNQDIEFPAPKEVVRARQEVIEADSLWIVTPEYNGSVPAALKNFLDWISRPVQEGENGRPQFVMDKQVAVSGASGRGAVLVIKELEGLLRRLGMRVLDKSTGISFPQELWQSGKFILSDGDKDILRQQIAGFLEA